MKKCEKDSCFNFYFIKVLGDSGLKNLTFCFEVEPENKNMFNLLHLLSYNQQNLQFLLLSMQLLSHLPSNSNFFWKTFLMEFYRVRTLRRGWDSRAGKMDLKVEGPWNTDKYWNFLNSRRSRMAKTVTLWPWWQPFNSFCFESLSFFPLFPFFLFATQKSGGAIPPRGPPSIAGPGFICVNELFLNF